MKSNNNETSSHLTNDKNRLNLGKQLNFLNNPSLLKESKDSLGLFNMDQELKENILEGEDCSSKFEQTQFLENASNRTWKKKSSQMENRNSLLFKERKQQERAIQLIRVTND